MRLLQNHLVICLLAVFACLVAPRIGYCAPYSSPVNFDREIRPILSDNCYKCHGPDEQARKAKLRLDIKDGGAFVLKKGKTPIVPGAADRSELVRRISSTDPDQMMPPPDSNRKLSAAQIQLLTRWVEEGATWSQHWSFVPPKEVAPPQTKLKGWTQNPIDNFVLAKVEAQGLEPSPPATREALIRRVSFDLTGLPPTPKEVAEFINDKDPKAYEHLVDRLLASPRYGERMATDWLDIARFADTHGYQADRYRPMWPYRDWVIKSFNENQPIDQFITWQLAGDLLPHATKEQRLATAFNRLHMQNEEGGIVEEEFRVAYVVDRVTTFGTAFLGLTFECSRCHDHKFDPITQRDFYSLFSFFQNIDESGQTSYFTDAIAVPTLLLSTDQQDQKLAEIAKEIKQKRAELDGLRSSSRDDFRKWLASKPVVKPIEGEIAAYPLDQITIGTVANSIDPKKPGKAIEHPKIIKDEGGVGAELSGENGFVFPSIGTFTRADPFSISLTIKAPQFEPRMVVLHHSKAPIDAGSRGYELLLEDGHVAFGLHHMWPGNSLKVQTTRPIEKDKWQQITVTYDGSSRAAGIAIYVNGQRQELTVIRDGLYKDITYETGGEPDLAIGYRFRDSGFKGGFVRDLRAFNRRLSEPEVEQIAGRQTMDQAITQAEKNDDASGGLLDYFLCNVYSPSRSLLQSIHELRQEQNRITNPIAEVMVMQEMAKPKPAFILKRGAYDAHREQVFENTPAFLPPMDRSAPRNRLGLALWVVSKQNPLTARVFVNRAWQQMFGKGIVETSDNFGSQGSPPTHPELLDYLACDFRDHGWDMKRLLKEIAMSATYQQSSRASAHLLAIDPANHLLARGPARKLTAEMLRDQALFDSGLLVEKLGGPSVKPYQPDGVWDVAMGHPHYDQGHGDDLHRRSLYTFWKRTVPPPAMTTFDAADRSICTVHRQETSTPLQALALLNDVQITEATRFMSQRMLREGGSTPDARICWLFELITDRRPKSRELTILRQLLEEQHEIFAADPASAKKLLNVGETKNDPSLDPVDLAAGTVLAEAILNLDDAAMRR